MSNQNVYKLGIFAWVIFWALSLAIFSTLLSDLAYHQRAIDAHRSKLGISVIE